MKSSQIIKEIRSRLNLNQSELADVLGVSFATVNRWEKGRCEPSQIAVNAIKIAYNRGKMESVRHSAIYNRFANLSKDCDMIIGYIANDRMFVVLDRFFNGEKQQNCCCS